MSAQILILGCLVSFCHSHVTEIFGVRKNVSSDDLTKMASFYFGYTLKENSRLGCVTQCASNVNCWSVLSCPGDDQSDLVGSRKYTCILLEGLRELPSAYVVNNAATCNFLSVNGRCANGGKEVNGTCICDKGFYGSNCEDFYRDCSDAFNKGLRGQHTYLYVKPYGLLKPLEVVCYLEWGGWTEIARQDKSCVLNYNRTWEDYKLGFGDITSCRWLGLEFLHYFTKEGFIILDVIITNETYSKNHAYYESFKIGSETENYILDYSGYRKYVYSTSADDGLGFGGSTHYAKGQPFATYDRDRNHCAQKSGTGWWFNSQCAEAILNLLMQSQVPSGSHYACWPVEGILHPINSYLLQIKRS